jgi:predicted RNase H-like HicB family nuclease
MRLSAVIRQEGRLRVAWCPELDVASQGGTEAEALANLKEAVELFLEDDDAPRPSRATLTSFEVGHDAAPGPVHA